MTILFLDCFLSFDPPSAPIVGVLSDDGSRLEPKILLALLVHFRGFKLDVSEESFRAFLELLDWLRWSTGAGGRGGASTRGRSFS